MCHFYCSPCDLRPGEVFTCRSLIGVSGNISAPSGHTLPVATESIYSAPRKVRFQVQKYMGIMNTIFIQAISISNSIFNSLRRMKSL